MTKFIQISMDGPNVNLKFLREIKKERAANELTSLLILVHATFMSFMEHLKQALKLLVGICTRS